MRKQEALKVVVLSMRLVFFELQKAGLLSRNEHALQSIIEHKNVLAIGLKVGAKDSEILEVLEWMFDEEV